MGAPLTATAAITLLAGRQAVVSRPLKGWPTRLRVEIQPAPGVASAPVLLERYEVGTPSARRALMNEANLTEQDVLRLDAEAIAWRDAHLAEERRRAEETAAAAAAAAAAADAAANADAHPTATAWGQIAVTCWAPGTTAEKTYTIESLEQFLALCAQDVAEGTFLKWSWPDTTKLCVLDADFHAGRAPTAEQVRSLVQTLQPTPAAWHTTTRGFHAIYAPCGVLRADELAAAALALHLASPLVLAYGGTAELLNRTRHPRSPHNGRCYGPIKRLLADDHLKILAVFDKASCSTEDAEEAMNHLGVQIGQRLPHTHCPIEPAHASSSANPVVVDEHGMFCFSCHGRLGNGFRSWGQIRKDVGLPVELGGEASVMTDAIKRWVPHAHVSRLLEGLAPSLPARLRPLLHRALLRRTHTSPDAVGVEDRIAAVFATFPFVRDANNLWRHEDTLQPTSPRLGRADLNHCSAVLRPTLDDDGNVVLKADPALVTQLASDGSVPGWFPVMPTALTPIWHLHHQAQAHGHLCVQPRGKHLDPLRYLPPAERMPVADAAQMIANRWPGIDFHYLALLHCARGWGEEGRSQLPMIWASGETGSGKTSTVWISCAMHGQVPEALNIETDNLEDINDKVAAAQGRTGALLLDDFCKNFEGRTGLQRRNATITFLLQFNRAVNYHEMYVGEKNRAVTTPLVMTDMRHPAELVQHEQLGRRIVLVQLNRPVDWKGGFADWWRPTDLRKAVETWHSTIVDDCFGDQPVPFLDIARDLGYNLLRDVYGQHEDEVSRVTLVRELITELLRRPEASGLPPSIRSSSAEQAAVSRSTGPGWVVLDNRARQPLEETAEMLCHTLNYESICVEGLKKALEPYQPKLHQLLPFSEPVRLEVRGYRMNAVLVRLVGNHRRKPLRLGAALLAPGATPDNMLDPGWKQEP